MGEEKVGAFAEPNSPFAQFRFLELFCRILSAFLSLVLIIVGGVSAGKGGIILLGILGPPAAVVILWSIAQFLLSTSRFEYMNFRSRFRMVIGIIITIGFGIADIACGLFRKWWATTNGDLSYAIEINSETDGHSSTIVGLTIAGLSLGCIITAIQIAIIWITYRRLTLHKKLDNTV